MKIITEEAQRLSKRKEKEMKKGYILEAEYDLQAGQTVYEYLGCTYGCCTPNETAVTVVPNQTPFMGVQTNNIVWTGEHE